jgi:hypothetical protein
LALLPGLTSEENFRPTHPSPHARAPSRARHERARAAAGIRARPLVGAVCFLYQSSLTQKNKLQRMETRPRSVPKQDSAGFVRAQCWGPGVGHSRLRHATPGAAWLRLHLSPVRPKARPTDQRATPSLRACRSRRPSCFPKGVRIAPRLLKHRGSHFWPVLHTRLGDADCSRLGLVVSSSNCARCRAL